MLHDKEVHFPQHEWLRYEVDRAVLGGKVVEEVSEVVQWIGGERIIIERR